jgi:hypothetical protein
VGGRIIFSHRICTKPIGSLGGGWLGPDPQTHPQRRPWACLSIILLLLCFAFVGSTALLKGGSTVSIFEIEIEIEIDKLINIK